ncbi:globin domain-containing protein [Undibacterium sp. TC4M20W]|uniref:globin domain-containing protein n=1 Tax=Undibacterium sp. TC4M20W TaxID=3413052 RepID=UPI003BF1EE45
MTKAPAEKPAKPALSSRAPNKAQLAAAEQWLMTIQDDVAGLITSGWAAAIVAPGDLAVDFYRHLFAAAPAVIELFAGDMTEQQGRLTHTLEETVALVHQPEHLLLLLRASGVRHHHYQVQQAYFGVMRNILIDTLATRGGAGFTAAHRAAWEGFFDNMATIMQHGMASAAKN